MHRFEAVDWDFLRPGFGTRVPLDALEGCSSNDPRTRELHSYSLGRERAAAELRTQPSLADLSAPTDPHRLFWWQGVGEATARHFDEATLYDSGQVEPMTLLRRTEATLRQISPLDRSGQEAALRAAASIHYAGQIDWKKVQGGWDIETLADLEQELRGLHATVQMAGWWSQGLHCGRALSEFHQPREIILPGGLERVPAPFFEGLGTALGERWGPTASIPRPRGLPLHGGRALREGYKAGVARRWLHSEDTDLPTLPLPN
jgi:hypothetical protein